MRFTSPYFFTKKQSPKDAAAVSHDLLVRAGFVHQEAAGIFSLLPLGLRVVRRIESIIRKEMRALGAEELLLPGLHPKKNWEVTGRWTHFDALLKTKSRWGETEYALGPTHEEIIVPLVSHFITSYRDLPLALFQIQTKFRDEPRAKSGVIRGREFGMKDLYSFHTSADELATFYREVRTSYGAIFAACGLNAKVTEASGGSFTKKFSHEFMVASPAGEDTVIVCAGCDVAQNEEIATLKENSACPRCGNVLAKEKAIEVGNIFDLGTKFSEAFNLRFTDASGARHPVVIGCYGIGTTRLLGTIVEVHHDETGIVWPPHVAPFDCHLVVLKSENKKIKDAALTLYRMLTRAGVEALLDNREGVGAGEKFADADLIGIPARLVVSEKTVEGNRIEIKFRNQKEAQLVSEKELIGLIRKSKE